MKIWGFAALAIVVLLGLTILKEVSAGPYDNYVWQYLKPTSIAGADDLKAKLEWEVTKITGSGHLAPYRTLHGEVAPRYAFNNRHDIVYTLSLAYPYVNSSLQSAIRTYLASEMASYPVWDTADYNTRYLKPGIGTTRNPDQYPAGLLATEFNGWGYKDRPRLFALYALWLYAHNTGNWAYVDNNWNTIKSFYTSYRSEANSHYTSIAGAIGYARMAEEKTTKDSAARDGAITDVNNAMANGLNYNQFAYNTENIFKDGMLADYAWIDPTGQRSARDQFFLGFHLIDVTPEVGRYMYDTPSLKALVLGNSETDIYSLKRAEYYYPLWYMAQSPMWSLYWGEGHSIQPEAKSMVFPIKAWVQKEPASQLRKYLDVPQALIGDDYYIQNLVRTIEASGTECWENIQTPAAEC
jgi:hypothetical protein